MQYTKEYDLTHRLDPVIELRLIQIERDLENLTEMVTQWMLLTATKQNKA